MDSDLKSIDLALCDSITFGRKPSCMVPVRCELGCIPRMALLLTITRVQLDDPTVSGLHCRVFYDDRVPLGSFASKNPASPPWTPGKATGSMRCAVAVSAFAYTRVAPPADPHGETFYGASHFWVEDLSSNGTFVNMVKLGRGKRSRLCHHGARA